MSRRAGAPIGNHNAANGTRWRDTLLRALMQYEDDTCKSGQALRKIADKLIQLALDGDKEAIQEIGNRLDGRVPAQSVNGDVGGFTLIIQERISPGQIERVFDE